MNVIELNGSYEGLIVGWSEMPSSVATSQANVYRANCQCELNFLLITQREAAQRSAAASGLITHCPLSPYRSVWTCCTAEEPTAVSHCYSMQLQHISLYICATLDRASPTARRASCCHSLVLMHPPLARAGGETVAARLWLLTPYKTLLCTDLCNAVVSPRLVASALFCAISCSLVQVSFIHYNLVKECPL